VADYEFPDELLYTADDEWIRQESDQVVIGVSDFAQNQLGDIVFVELPEVGSTTEIGKPFGTIESVKAVSDLTAPLSGEVLSINAALEDEPEKVNESCYGDGWLIVLRLSEASEIESLLDAEKYRASVAERDES
jgi:glycine cleavage system H protein